MADQTQTESLDQGATKDSSAEGNGGVNGMTNKTIKEESRTDVNDKIDKECQKRNSGADDNKNNESSDTSHTEKTIPGTDKTTHEGESKESKAGNDQTNVLIGKPVNEKHDEASYNGEGETNNEGIITDNVNTDQTDATVKESSQTFEDDSCSNEPPDEKMITGMDRHETANKETNDEIIPESIGYKKDANRQNEATMTCSNEILEADVNHQDKKGLKYFVKKHIPGFGSIKIPTLNRQRDNMLIQNANKQLEKKHQEFINETLKEKKGNAKTLNETTALLRARDGKLEEYRSVIQQNNADISQLTAQIQQLQEDQSDLLLRLSKVASAKLTQNNPNIADLSDANRPTKLAEQFSELYDNEYTDAIEELKEQQGLEEQAAIENMLTLLQAANKECVEMARKQENGKTCLTTFSFKVDQYPILQERSMLTESGDNECSTVKTTVEQETEEVRIEIQLPDEPRKSLSDIRRLCATKVEEDCSISKIIASKIALQWGITPESGPKTLAYITKCAKLCWYMVIKEPPVLVGFRAVVDGEPFNKDTYRSYRKAGESLDFVVWPPLYLHKDGPLLCKGVAQGKLNE